jgi:peptide/nickel transport system substrate-binding protein
MRPYKLLLAASVLLISMLVVACGGSDEEVASSSTTTKAEVKTEVKTEAKAEVKTEAKAEATKVASSDTSSSSAAAASLAKSDKPKVGGSYKFQTTAPRIGQDPINTTGTGYFYNWGQGLSSLLRYKLGPEFPVEAYIVTADLVKTWSQPADNEYIFNIDPAAKWHNVAPTNGRAFTAKDAVYSINRLASKSSYHRGYWADLKAVEVIDDLTFKVTLNAPAADFLALTAFGFNKMMAEDAVEAGGGNLQNGPQVGTGEWLVSCENDVQCIYKKNPTAHLKDEHGNGIPYLDELRNVIIPDVNARFAAFRSQLIDGHALTPEQKMIVDAKYPQVNIIKSKSYSGAMIHFRNDQAPFNDVNVRQAVSLAIDRQELIDTIHNGKGFFSYSMVQPSVEAYVTQEEFAELYIQDIARCKSLLAEAGYANGLSTTMWVANYSSTYVAVMELVQQQLKECGIDIELYIHDRPTYLAQVFIRDGKFDGMAFGPQGTFTADAWLLAYYHSNGSRNSGYTRDSKLDAMIDAQHIELDKDVRNKMMLEIQHYLLKQNYQLVLYGGLSDNARWPWIKGTNFSAGADYPGGRVMQYYWNDPDVRAEFGK